MKLEYHACNCINQMTIMLASAQIAENTTLLTYYLRLHYWICHFYVLILACSGKECKCSLRPPERGSDQLHQEDTKGFLKDKSFLLQCADTAPIHPGGGEQSQKCHPANPERVCFVGWLHLTRQTHLTWNPGNDLFWCSCKANDP